MSHEHSKFHLKMLMMDTLYFSLLIYLCFILTFIRIYALSNDKSEPCRPINLEKLVVFLHEAHWQKVLFVSQQETDLRQFVGQTSSHFVMATPLYWTSAANLSVTNIQNSLIDVIIVWCNVEKQQEFFIRKALQLNMFTRRNKWLFVTHNIEERRILMTNLHDVLTSDSSVYSLSLNMKSCIYDILKLLPARYGIFTYPLGKFSHATGHLRWSRKTTFPSHKHNLRIGVLRDPPFNVGLLQSNESYGYMDEMVEIIARSAGFRYSYVLEESGKYGLPSENGTWDGLMAKLEKEEVDIGAVGFTMLPTRMDICEFSTVILEVGMAVLIRRPSEFSGENFKFKTYIEPFSRGVWLAMAITWVASALCIAIITNGPSSSEKDISIRVLDELWALFVVITNQVPAPCTSGWHALRIVMFCYLLCALVLIRCYGGVLVASLTVKKVNSPFEDAMDLLKSGYKIGALGSSSNIHKLKLAKTGTLHEVWKTMATDPSTFVLSKKEGTEKAYLEKFGFITDEIHAASICESNCSFVTLPSYIINDAWHFAFPKNSQYRDLISRQIQYMRETGILPKLRHKHLSKSTVRTCQVSDSAQDVGLKQSIGAFIAFGIGTALGLGIFCVEIYKSK